MGMDINKQFFIIFTCLFLSILYQLLLFLKLLDREDPMFHRYFPVHTHVYNIHTPSRTYNLPKFLLTYTRYVEDQRNVKKASYLRTSLAEPVKTVRQQVQTVWEQVSAVKNTATDHLNVFQDRSACKY